MQIAEEVRGDVTILRPVGPIDSAAAPRFEARLFAALAPATVDGDPDAPEKTPVGLVLDLSAVTQLTPAGLRSLLLAVRQARPGGGSAGGRKGVRIVLAAVPGPVRAALEEAGLAALLESHGDVDAAVRAASQH
ncbi:anti-anti-sigma regulatory factor [Azospirillum brasilense]|uniref:Anti-anti-sigma regulatory factor n=1 Tax=Azospirillum brasilense TaxID=192 RepID=A0A560BFZ9_AZOBR|nr:STAS domain-containing protein [Azospirillum brasilense]TWA71538.1 anti-anti-sigma regulatory factor [Azospirillum brasilense]